MAVFAEGGIDQRLQHLQCLLDQPICHRRDAQLALGTVRLGNQYLGSRFTLHASFPRSVALTQLRFTLLTVTSSQRDLHPQVCAHAGRTDRHRGPPL